MRPLAIVPVFNEADILPWTLNHLKEQGCDVHVIDNWSTDGSDEVARRYGAVERWPLAGTADIYDWTGILRRIEDVAAANPGRWIVFSDADEIRRAPTRDDRASGDYTVTLTQALAGIEKSGYNAVCYRVVTFVPVNDEYRGNPEKHFQYYTLAHVDTKMAHVKTWIQGAEKVDLHTHGGHQALFRGRNVCPIPFILKHYPIRTQRQGERKLFLERLPRYPAAERAKNWHVQYDGYQPGQNLIRELTGLVKTE